MVSWQWVNNFGNKEHIDSTLSIGSSMGVHNHCLSKRIRVTNVWSQRQYIVDWHIEQKLLHKLLHMLFVRKGIGKLKKWICKYEVN